MVFSRFFKGRDRDDVAPEQHAHDEPDDAAEADGDVAPEYIEEVPPATRAAAILPTGASTGSKRPDAIYGHAPYGPTHYVRASGCHLETTEGATLVDCTMALGAVALGYADPHVTRAVMETAGAGHVTGLSPVLEIEVAERFCEMVPCAERVQFLKSGAEAMSAAVRLARTYTGRDAIVGSGYFGWHDWCSTGEGTPRAVSADYHAVPFDDLGALQAAVSKLGTSLAAVVIEPVVERLPSVEWLRAARELCDRHGAVLVFDEMKTGFRFARGGYQEIAEVTPDLAAFGKALANGFPLAAVCGRKDIMDAARKTWISSTLGSEGTALAAAYVVLELHREHDLCKQLAETGDAMQGAVQDALDASGLEGVEVRGLSPMWFLKFDSADREAEFLRYAAEAGALFKKGPYNFASLAHDDEAIRAIEGAASEAFVRIVREG